MPFPRRLLTGDEEIVVELRPHWIFLGWPLFVTAAVVAFAIFVAAVFSHAPVGVLYLLLAVVVAFSLWLLSKLPLIAWGRFIIWLVLGLAIYALYGRRHSALNRE